MLPKRSSDEECIEHNRSTLTTMLSYFWVKKQKQKRHAYIVYPRSSRDDIQMWRNEHHSFSNYL